MKKWTFFIAFAAVILFGTLRANNLLPGKGGLEITAAEQSLLNKYVVNLQQSIGLSSTAQQLANRAHPRLLLPSGGSFNPAVINNQLTNDYNRANLYKLPVMVISVRTIRSIDQPNGNDQIPGLIKEYTLERNNVNSSEPGTIWLMIPADSTLSPMLYEIGKL